MHRYRLVLVGTFRLRSMTCGSWENRGNRGKTLQRVNVFILNFQLNKSVGLEISITPCKQRVARGIDAGISANSVGI